MARPPYKRSLSNNIFSLDSYFIPLPANQAAVFFETVGNSPFIKLFHLLKPRFRQKLMTKFFGAEYICRT